MANFRRNHSKETRGSTSTYVRAAIFAALLIGLLYVLYGSIKGMDLETLTQEVPNYAIPENMEGSERVFLPAFQDSQNVVHHTAYSLKYNERHEQADWVAYELTKENLRKPNVKRSGYFNTDPQVKSRSAKHSDYTRSGFTRGHLAPAGDMAQNEKTMEESFYMSNMSPQLRTLNNGIWKELEEQIRDWTFDDGRLFIVTGGVLNGKIVKKIGKNRVSVPDQFYKVILDIDDPKQKAIGFLIPNRRCEEPLIYYAKSVDEIENITGIDFFDEIMAPELEAKIESEMDVNLWKFSSDRYRQRVENWNHQ